MLVNLLHLPEDDSLLKELGKQNIKIQRAMAPDKWRIIEWVEKYSTRSAAGECDVCFSHTPISCWIASRGSEILGYACYDATAPDFFGPTRVLEEEQGKGIGKALLLESLKAMREKGYAYAIIGGIGPAAFYEKCVSAILIPDSTPGIYKDYLGRIKE